MCPTHGSTMRRRRWATKSLSTDTSTFSSRRVRLSEIDADLKHVTGRILKMIEGLAA